MGEEGPQCTALPRASNAVKTALVHTNQKLAVYGHHAADQQREYLGPSLNLSLMYKLYVEKCKQDEKVTVKERAYRQCFNTEYNLSFNLPQKDTSKTCDIAKVAIEADNNKTKQEKLRKEHELHLRTCMRKAEIK